MTDIHAKTGSTGKTVSLTRNEDLVLTALRGESAPQTAYQLLDRLRADGIKAPLQVYRALRSLGDRRLVHRLESLNAFVACCHDHGEVRHSAVFAICDRCGRVDEFADTLVDEQLDALAGRMRFRMEQAAVEIRGVCGDCADEAGSAVEG
ncbi:Fur family transcriptional regulator [Aureimonas sp. AU12]|uniref:Fur family transcriptional regulator n=1 Tax=Aureimonas sp. AU12 TaxID=1638161 RepID=UPI000A62A964|nr:Fur family transcriptional regulator [Aureimonas sp. AU12]